MATVGWMRLPSARKLHESVASMLVPRGAERRATAETVARGETARSTQGPSMNNETISISSSARRSSDNLGAAGRKIITWVVVGYACLGLGSLLITLLVHWLPGNLIGEKVIFTAQGLEQPSEISAKDIKVVREGVARWLRGCGFRPVQAEPDATLAVDARYMLTKVDDDTVGALRLYFWDFQKGCLTAVLNQPLDVQDVSKYFSGSRSIGFVKGSTIHEMGLQRGGYGVHVATAKPQRRYGICRPDGPIHTLIYVDIKGRWEEFAYGDPLHELSLYELLWRTGFDIARDRADARAVIQITWSGGITGGKLRIIGLQNASVNNKIVAETWSSAYMAAYPNPPDPMPVWDAVLIHSEPYIYRAPTNSERLHGKSTHGGDAWKEQIDEVAKLIKNQGELRQRMDAITAKFKAEWSDPGAIEEQLVETLRQIVAEAH